MLGKVVLIHSNRIEALKHLRDLRADGLEIVHAPKPGPNLRRALSTNPPVAVVIDLDRSPSVGRDVALAIRLRAATRRVPLVFAGGEPDSVARTRTLLPDAVYTSWSRVRSALKSAIARPPRTPAAPASLLAGYSGTPLPRKLCIKPGTRVILAGAPKDFRKTLGELPDGARLRNDAQGPCDLILWFTRSRLELRGGIARMAARLEHGSMWLIWPKQTSRMASDLTQQEVRETGLAAGLVDYKVCAVDRDWSGLLFTRRKPKRSGSARG